MNDVFEEVRTWRCRACNAIAGYSEKPPTSCQYCGAGMRSVPMSWPPPTHTPRYFDSPYEFDSTGENPRRYVMTTSGPAGV
jgi:hypothetical protein